MSTLRDAADVNPVEQKIGVSLSLSVDMLPFGVTISATVQQRSEIPERLLNYPVLQCMRVHLVC